MSTVDLRFTCKSCNSRFTHPFEEAGPFKSTHVTCPHCDKQSRITSDLIKEGIKRIQQKKIEEDTNFTLQDQSALVSTGAADRFGPFGESVLAAHRELPELRHWAAENQPGDVDRVHRALLELAAAIKPPEPAASPGRDQGRETAKVFKDQDFDSVLEVVSLQGIEGRLAELKQGLDSLTAALAEVKEAASIWQGKDQPAPSFKKIVSTVLNSKNQTSLPSKIQGISDKLGQQATAIIEAFQTALAQRPDRQPVEVDADRVAAHLLALLADSANARALFAHLSESYFEDRRKAVALILKDLPSLFDGLEKHLAFWKSGQGMSAEEARARDQVVKVLSDLKADADHWRERHQIEVIPDLEDRACRYDERMHERYKTVPTEDPALHGTIQHVIEFGYLWKGQHERIRRALVAVWGPPLGWNAAASQPGADGVQAGATPGSAPGSSHAEATTDHE